MGLQKVALNFMVERGGKLAKSLLCTKPQKITNTIGLKYAPLKADVVEFKLDKLVPKVNKFPHINKDIINKIRTQQLKTDFSFRDLNLLPWATSIRPKNYIEPLQKEFKGLKQVRKYAKDNSIDALKSENPFEHLVIIDKDTKRIVTEIDGKQSVSTKGLSIPDNASMVHGHPTLKTMQGTSVATPISFNDFGVLNKNGSDIIAFNTAGEFSMLAKKPNFKPLSKEQFYYYGQIHSTYIVYENNLIPRIASKLPLIFQDCKSRQEIKLIMKELETKFGLNRKQIQQIKAKCMQVVKDNIGLGEVKGIHNFWQDYADELGVIYKTNYSYL